MFVVINVRKFGNLIAINVRFISFQSQELQDYNNEGKFPNNFEHLEPSKHQNVYNLTRQ